MVKISITNDKGRIFPDNILDDGYLDNYKDKDSRIANLASTLALHAMMGTALFELGDSKTVVKIIPTGHTMDEGRQEFEQYVRVLVSYIESALPSMSDKYRAFYKYFITDYKQNGLNMPLWWD